MRAPLGTRDKKMPCPSRCALTRGVNEAEHSACELCQTDTPYLSLAPIHCFTQPRSSAALLPPVEPLVVMAVCR